MSKTDVKTALQQRAQDVARAADLLLQKTRDWQRIELFVCNRLQEPLTPEQEKKLTRYQFVYNQMISGKYTDNEIVQQLINIHKVKITQAYEDVKKTREIWPKAINVTQEMGLQVQLEINRKAQIKAMELGDMKSFAQLEKNRIKMLSMLEKEDDTMADAFEGYQIEPVFNPDLIGAPKITRDDALELLKAINAKRGKKVNLDIFTDIDWEDVE